jgi:hypothetical protein
MDNAAKVTHGSSGVDKCTAPAWFVMLIRKERPVTERRQPSRASSTGCQINKENSYCLYSDRFSIMAAVRQYDDAKNCGGMASL